MSEGSETENAVLWALRDGYRHIDTARLYANEKSVGNAVRQFINESSVLREEIFVTTKLWPSDYLNPGAGFYGKFRKTRSGIYRPVPLYTGRCRLCQKIFGKTFEKIYEQGLAKSIGVSNYDESDIEEVLAYAKVAPMVNQVEFNPTSYDLDLLKFCKDKNIVS